MFDSLRQLLECACCNRRWTSIDGCNKTHVCLVMLQGQECSNKKGIKGIEEITARIKELMTEKEKLSCELSDYKRIFQLQAKVLSGTVCERDILENDGCVKIRKCLKTRC